MAPRYLLATFLLILSSSSAYTIKKVCADDEYMKNQTSCAPCSVCDEPGYGLTQPCSRNDDITCSPCHPGLTFSHQESPGTNRRCIPCRNCINRKLLRPCSTKQDAACSDCLPGFFEDSFSFECLNCSICVEDDYAECMKSGTECRQRWNIPAELLEQGEGALKARIVSGRYLTHVPRVSIPRATGLVDELPDTRYQTLIYITTTILFLLVVCTGVLLYLVVHIRSNNCVPSNKLIGQLPLNNEHFNKIQQSFLLQDGSMEPLTQHDR